MLKVLFSNTSFSDKGCCIKPLRGMNNVCMTFLNLFILHMVYYIQYHKMLKKKQERQVRKKKIVIIVLKLDLHMAIIHMMNYKNLSLDHLILVVFLLQLIFKV